jgi:hypothetical protein
MTKSRVGSNPASLLLLSCKLAPGSVLLVLHPTVHLNNLDFAMSFCWAFHVSEIAFAGIQTGEDKDECFFVSVHWLRRVQARKDGEAACSEKQISTYVSKEEEGFDS